MNMLCTKFIRYKFVVWCTFQCSWDTSIPPFVEAVYSSGDIDCPTFLADLDLRQSLVILRASTCCKSSAEARVRSGRRMLYCFRGAHERRETTKCEDTQSIVCAYQINGESHLLFIEEVL